MASAFNKAHKFTAIWEGGVSDHPNDRGGVTAFGASIEFVKGIASTASGKNFLQAQSIKLPITRATILSLTKEQAAAMFKREFWDKLGLDRLPYRQALLLYDAAVNHGPKKAVVLSQRGCNKLVTYGVRLEEDGIIGPKTLAALKADTDALVKAIIQARREYYAAIVENKPDQQVFYKGWLNRANALERCALGGM